MRIVKQRLLEMVPDLSVFLDVDDLEEIGNLQSYIDRSHNVLGQPAHPCTLAYYVWSVLL